jgi:hypothetical protein
MATTSQDTTLPNKGMLIPSANHKAFLEYAQGTLTKHKLFDSIRNKFDAIDIAYARYKQKCAEAEASGSGIDVVSSTAEANCGCNVFGQDDVTPPIVVSQVDSYVAYLAEIFLTGSPLFPVVSEPAQRVNAEKLEAILDDHSSLGGYPRQLLLTLRDGAKYNFGALETDWDSIPQFSILSSFETDGQKINKKHKKFTKLKRLNPRNTVWDWSLSPGDVAEHGDYAGYIEQISRTKLQKLFLKWKEEGLYIYNKKEALLSSLTSTAGMNSATYRRDPIISNYVNSDAGNSSPEWDKFFDGKSESKTVEGHPGANYEIYTLYARIMPADFGLGTGFAPKTPQIWKLVFCNNRFLIHAKRIISAYDYLPILFIQPLEDGMGYQTQSVAEGEIPFQEAAATLFNIRFAAARRAVSDRAIYDAEIISPADVNSSVPAPKIPAKLSALSNKKISDAYYPIPFDMRGTETTIQDANMLVQFSKELHGINGPRQGSFQKGNKSVREWEDTMGGSEGRMRLPALTIEYQFFSPLRSILALNIFQYGEDGVITSQTSGRSLEIKVEELRKANLSFKMADGYTPKAKLASTDAISTGIQMIQNNPILQQQLGPSLVPMFLHFMSLMGVKGMDQYDPRNPANAIAQQPVANMNVNDPNAMAVPATPTGMNPGMVTPPNAQPIP